MNVYGITFDKKGENKRPKEDIEWSRIWCENTNDETLPRVALIGDSITEGYYNAVKEGLKGIANVDYMATSYSIKNKPLKVAVKTLLCDSKYKVVHFNNGLHGYCVSDSEYEENLKELMSELKSEENLVLSTITTVLDKSLEKIDDNWKDVIVERNKSIYKIADELNIPVDDLRKVCDVMPKEYRCEDGVHMKEEGYKLLAESVIESVKKLL